MKNILTITAIALVSVFAVSTFSSCSSFDEEDFLLAPANNGNNNGNNDNKDDNKDQESDWGVIMEKTFGHINDEYPSTITLQKEDGSIVEFKVNLPFEYTLGTDEFTTTDNAEASAFVKLEVADTTSTAWTADGKGNYLRKITRTQQVVFTKFTRTLVSSHWEAYRYINGKKEYYVTANETSSYEGVNRQVSEIENNDKNYERESNLVTMSLIFNKESFSTSATTYVDREIVKENNETEDPTPSMPDATLNVDNIVKATTLTSSPEYNADNSKVVKWHTVSLVEATSKYYVYVDGSFVQTWDKSDLAASSKYNSALLVNGRWTPAVITMDGNGWKYSVEYADGSYKVRDMPMNLALSSGIKNFSENNTAEVTPFIKTIVDSKDYSGKKYMTISGYTVEGKMYIAYTVAEK